jgi:cell division protein FtsB
MFVLISLVALLIALYMGILLFGKNSFEVFMNLEDEEVHLQADIERLKAENAKLQKSFFEQKELLGKGKE